MTLETERPDLAIHIAGETDPTEAIRLNPKRLIVLIPKGVIIDTDRLREQFALTTIIRLPYVVGTGMTGLLMEIVRMIKRGTMFHIKDNTARTSVIHALDVARIAIATAETGGDFTVTDLTSPTWHDIIEALSVRVDHKRIPTLNSRWGRYAAMVGPLIGGPDREMLRTITSDYTLTSNLPNQYCTGIINVADYLSNHEYDETDI